MRTSELTGAALDWAVAKCEGYTVHIGDVSVCGIVTSRKVIHVSLEDHSFPFEDEWSPSTNWEQGGPIIERENISVGYQPSAPDHSKWYATNRAGAYGISETPLIAAMRCYVAPKLGYEVEIPKERTC